MTFTPDRSTIVSITNANPAVVTTTPDHGMHTGNVARLVVPNNYGMTQINGSIVSVIVLSPTTFSCYRSLVPTSIPVNSIDFAAFITPTTPRIVASCIPVGSGPCPITEIEWQRNNEFCESKIDDAVLNNSTVEIPF